MPDEHSKKSEEHTKKEEQSKKSKIKISKNYIYLGVVLLIIAGTVVYLKFNNVNAQVVQTGDLVTVDYTGTLEDGTVFDTSIQSVATKNNIVNLQRTYQPIQFTVGSGQLIKGFDDSVIGMKVGETKKITLQPKDAYGDIQQDLILNINASVIQTSQKQLVVGSTIVAPNGANGIITKIENGNATIDFNHPLAGNVLNFEIILVKIGK